MRGIHAQNRKATEALAGQRCALNLAGERVAKDAIRRGDVILAPALHAPTDRIDATVHVLASEAKPTGAWFPVRLHSHAAEVGARIVPLAGPLAAWCNWFSTAPFNTRPHPWYPQQLCPEFIFQILRRLVPARGRLGK